MKLNAIFRRDSLESRMPAPFSTAKRFFDDIISSPINICLVALICYFSYKLIKKDSGGNSVKNEPNQPKRLEKMAKRDFTREQLKEYDGVKSNGRILIGVLGRVFDVSAAHQFYGPGNDRTDPLICGRLVQYLNHLLSLSGGPYSVFAGRDASRALATFSVDETQFKDTDDDLSDLKPSQMDSVKEWEMQFLGKS